MRSRLVTCTTAVVAAALCVAPAHAATKKPKPITGTYTVTLNPDPTADVWSETGQSDPSDGSCGSIDTSQDAHKLAIPAKGTLHVVLDSPNPLPADTPLGPDWDLHILDSDGSELDSSHGTTAHEETFDKFKKKQPVTILVCNITGGPSATVTYTFTYS